MSDELLIIGEGGGGKGGGGGSVRTAREAPDSLHSIQYAKVLDLVSEGEIEGLVNGLRSVYLNGTPMENKNGSNNFSGFTVRSRNGTQEQSILPGFNTVETEKPINLKVENGSPIVATITNGANIDAARVTVAVPRLTKQNTKNGDIKGTSVKLRIEYQVDGGGYVPAKINTKRTSASIFGNNSNTVRAAQSTEGISFQTTVIWNRPQVGTKWVSVPYETNFGYTTYTSYRLEQVPVYGGTVKNFKLQYRVLNSGNSWSDYNLFTIRKPSSNLEPTEEIFVQIPNLPEDKYEFRAVNTSGPGTLAFSNATYERYTGDFTITGKTTRRYLRALEFPLEGGGDNSSYDLRVTRLTADSTSSALQNETFFDSYTEIIEDNLDYPNSALMGISIDSSQFTNIPERGYDIRGLRVKIPSNYNPDAKTYSGLWDGTFKVAWTDNPAWCVYDLIVNDRYGMGKYINEVELDKWTFYELAQYCDELVPDGFGSKEPRYTMNAYLQSREDAYKVLQSVASIFRGTFYWSNNALAPIYDHPQDPIAAFTNSNVVNGSFIYSGSSQSARHNVALVRWNDPNDLYKPKVEYVELQDDVAKRGVIEKEVTTLGITSQGQAHRLGKWILYTEKYESEVVNFKSSLEFHGIQPGSIIEIYDKNRAGERYGGRIISGTTTSIEIDSPIEIKAGFTYTLKVVLPEDNEKTLPDGSVESTNTPNILTRTLSNTDADGKTTTLTWDTPLSSIPLNNATWAVTVEESVEPQLFNVVSITESGEPGLYEVTASEHNPSKFDHIEEGMDLEIRPTSNSKPLSPPPESITLEEELYKSTQGVKNKIFIEWETSEGILTNALSYNVEIKVDDGNWERVGTSIYGTSLELVDVLPGDYYVRVMSLNSISVESPPTEVGPFKVLGKTAPPEDVTGFKATKRVNDILLEWNPVGDLDFSHYEIRKGSSWDGGTTLISNYSGTTYITDENESGDYYYHIKAVDTSGNFSAGTTTVKITIQQPQVVSGFLSVQLNNRIEFTWDENPETDLVHYEIREGTNWETGFPVAKVKTTYTTVPSGTTATRNYMIKAKVSPGILSESAAFTTTKVAMPVDRNLIKEFDESLNDFPSSKHYASVIGGNLRADNNTNYSEYVWSVELPTKYTAQNTLYNNHDIIRTDDQTWATETFTWESNAALRLWKIAATENLTSVKYQFAFPKDTLDINEIEAFRYSATTDGFTGTVANTEEGVSFGNGRFGNALDIRDITTVDYTGMSIPTEFRINFWIIPSEIVTAKILSLENTSSGDVLDLIFDSLTNTFKLKDKNDITVSVSKAISAEDRLLVGIAQNSTERKLFIGDLFDESVAYSIENLAPIGTWDKLNLY